MRKSRGVKIVVPQWYRWGRGSNRSEKTAGTPADEYVR